MSDGSRAHDHWHVSRSLGFTLLCALSDWSCSTRVAAALVSNILFGHHTLFDMNSSVNELDGATSNEGGAWDGRESEPYLHGEYKLVLQLVAVLQVRTFLLSSSLEGLTFSLSQYGKLAKKLTDRAIECAFTAIV